MKKVKMTSKETLLSLYDFLKLVTGNSCPSEYKEQIDAYCLAIKDILGELQENKMAIEDLESQVEFWRGKTK